MAGNFGGRPRGGQDNRTVVLLGLALVFLCVLIGLAVMFMNTQQPTVETATNTPASPVQAPVEQRMVEIVVPLQDIQQGVQLQPSMFKKVSKPESAVDERAIREFEGIVNMYSRTVLVANAPVMQDLVSNVKPVNPLIIPSGFRAVTIRVNATSSVEGWARAGSKVDVNWISVINGRRTLTTLVQGAKVLSAERQASSNVPQGAAVPSTITLLVTAADAKKIQLAEAGQGQISLDLRGDQDVTTSAGSETISDATLINGSEPKQQPVGTTGTVIIDGRKWGVDPRGKLFPLPED